MSTYEYLYIVYVKLYLSIKVCAMLLFVFTIFVMFCVKLMTGTIPSEMGVLTNLRFLRAGANMFSGTLPNDICNLKDIVLFEFQVNEIVYA